MYIRVFGRELSISSKECSLRRTDNDIPTLAIGRFRFEYERFADGIYLRLNGRECFIWT